MHVVLGASGPIGLGVLKELQNRGIACTGVARTKREGWTQADLTNTEQTLKACEGATHLYLCAGLAYDITVWRRDWPRVMDNVIAAAEANSASVVFVDNIYMYGPPPLQQPITEDHPQEPSSQKGKVRKELAHRLLQAHNEGKISALIARAPDFYGPGATTSLLYPLIFANLFKGKPAMWLGNPRLNHSFGYIGDISRSMVVLALDTEAFGQVWHTPTSSQPVTARDIHAMTAHELGIKSRLMAIPHWMVRVMKLFVPIMREIEEMTYQSYSDYVFSSAKFEARYPSFKITPYEEGIKQVVAEFRAGKGLPTK
jgi:nucleoside-diphosphate-sugar epimerase